MKRIKLKSKESASFEWSSYFDVPLVDKINSCILLTLLLTLLILTITTFTGGEEGNKKPLSRQIKEIRHPERMLVIILPA